MSDKWEKLTHKFALLMDQKPEGIKWGIFDVEQLEWWLNKSVEYELYSLTALVKKHIDERKVKTAE